jgi:hypothetical protein
MLFPRELDTASLIYEAYKEWIAIKWSISIHFPHLITQKAKEKLNVFLDARKQ